MTVYVCLEKDIDCGDLERNWCATCPKRQRAPEGYELDAKRYRWLREQHGYVLQGDPEKCDEEIDAAMTERDADDEGCPLCGSVEPHSHSV